MVRPQKLLRANKILAWYLGTPCEHDAAVAAVGQQPIRLGGIRVGRANRILARYLGAPCRPCRPCRHSMAWGLQPCAASVQAARHPSHTRSSRAGV